MDKDGVRTLASTFRGLFHVLHEGFRKQVRGLDHGTLNWRPLPKANSIAVLVTHSLGSEREMLRSVRLVATERDRSAWSSKASRSPASASTLNSASRTRSVAPSRTARGTPASRPRPRHSTTAIQVPFDT